MNVKNLSIKLLCVIAVAALAALAMYPPEKRLKPGIDLAGGHSLLYEIDTAGLDDSQLPGLAQKIISQLRKRVDPNGQRNLVWRPLGDTRIEIQMPTATGAARDLREAREQAIEAALKLDVPRTSILAALEQPAEQRLEALKALNKGVESRNEPLAALADVYENYRKIKAGEAPAEAGQDEATAFTKYEQALQKVLDTNLTRARLSDLLDLPPGPARDEQLATIKTRFSAYAGAIDAAVQKNDEWSKDRSLLEDPEDLKRLLRGAGVLEFRIMAERDESNPSRLKSTNPALAQQLDEYVRQLQERGPRPKLGQPYEWFKIQDPVSYFKAKDQDDIKNQIRFHSTIVEQYAGSYYALAFSKYADPVYRMLAARETPWKLVRALPTRDFNTGKLIVQFGLDSRGGVLFGRLTGANVGRQLGMFLDNECMSSARIESEIHESGVIQGDFSNEDVTYLVSTLEAGSLPARLKEPPLSERSIGASLGETNLRNGVRAAVISLILVTVFMLVYYMISGAIADVAVLMNILLVLGAMCVLEATFTAAGIAGLILTIGMSVDSNVLINERIREELQRGASLKMAVKNGYDRAFRAILDSHVTTLITSAILGYAGGDELRGFAIVLGLGVAFNLFTAVFVTRIILAALIQRGILKSLPMLRMIGVPKVRWVGLRRFFWPISLAAVVGSVLLYGYEHNFSKPNIYDIEFLGGTAVTIELTPEKGLTDTAVRERVNGSGPDDRGLGSAAGWLRFAADELPKTSVSPGAQAGVFALHSATLTAQQLEMAVMAGMNDALELSRSGGLEPVDSHTLQITISQSVSYDAERVRGRLNDCSAYLRSAAQKLATAKVVVAWDSARQRREAGGAYQLFDINTTETNKQVVREAILASMGDVLKIERPLEYELRIDPLKAPHGSYAIYSEEKGLAELRLADIIGGETLADVDGFQGGVAIVFDDAKPPQTELQIRDRLHSARLLPEFSVYKYRPFKIVGLSSALEDATKPVEQRRLTSFALLVADESLIYEDDPAKWETGLAEPELNLAKAALSSEKTLQKVTQFAPQVASQMTQQAIMAILLACVAIAAYIWFRFGNMQFGLAAIIALVHDIALSLGAVAASYYIYMALGENMLLIRDFKIDLTVVAALLTILGYSINDKIVVFDRIRETRGKLKEVKESMIDLSINETLSRTALTGMTTLLSLIVMYVGGGDGVHGFAFCMFIGIVAGTYSSVAIGAPLLLYPTLLKWITYLMVAGVLVGLALSMTETELRVMMWVVAALFGVAVVAWEMRRSRPIGATLAPGGA